MTDTNARIEDVRKKVVAAGQASMTAAYMESGKGALLFDVNGKEYIDFAGGIAVMNVGHSHPKVVQAIKDQAEKLTHTCFMVTPYQNAVDLADKLCGLVPGDFEKKAMFVNSGAEAVENAVKIARYYTGKPGIIALDGGFHGRTLLTMSLTSKVKPYKFGFGPYAPEIYRMPAPYCYRCPFDTTYPECDCKCADALETFLIGHTAPENTAAFIAEPVLGEGGFIVPPAKYFQKIARICKENDILFIADEIQTGIARTGAMFAMERMGVEADITTTAKSLAAGMPLSAVVGKKQIMDSVHPSGLGGTYGGNPVACSAALAVLDIIKEENLIEKSRTLGQKVTEKFSQFKDQYELVGDVRGLGAMVGMELVKDIQTKEPAPEKARALVQYCFEHGLILLACGTYGNVIRALMPLVIEDELLDKGLGVIEQGLAQISKN